MREKICKCKSKVRFLKGVHPLTSSFVLLLVNEALPEFLGARTVESCSGAKGYLGWWAYCCDSSTEWQTGHTFVAVEVVPVEDSALLKGILTSSLPGVFSTTRFMATPSVACRIFPLPTQTHQRINKYTKSQRMKKHLQTLLTIEFIIMTLV